MYFLSEERSVLRGEYIATIFFKSLERVSRSNKYAMTGNWSNQNPNPGLKPKREITYINSQNTKRTYGQPSRQLFPKSWPLRTWLFVLIPMADNGGHHFVNLVTCPKSKRTDL